ncbi:serine/threonine-protein kinase [Dactylosporangium sp. NPDC049140]|uniref:serine/threonine-protein kinase n=1 Tax=Dactylosporangium sp. NPDC049140 TaxID=3155647 RepID=UPI0033EFF0F5
MTEAPRTVRVPDGYRVGSWRVTRALASGNWSTVYAAVRDTGEEAALKFIPTGTLTARRLSHLADMAGRELAAHRRLSHPNLIKVLDSLVVDDPAQPVLDGATVIALELAEGSAATALAATDGGLPDAGRLIAEVCAGLAYLHEAGWVHGDLKPSNILLMADGSVRLADFGLAAELDGTHAYLPPGGTADYVPPERWAEGLRAGGVAVRQTSDIWALGVTACQLLTGRLPFAGVTSRARTAAACQFAEGRAELTLPDGLTPRWRAFIVDCLAPDHHARLRHTAESLRQRACVAAEKAGAPAGRLRRPFGVLAMAGVAAVTVASSVAYASLEQAAGTADPAASTSPTAAGYERYFRTDADIPRQYYDLIIEAGTKCPSEPAVTPYLVAAILKAESNFDPDLSDPAKNEYGIARWTPNVLQYYLPTAQREAEPKPPFPPEMSIPPMGDYLCRFAPLLHDVPGDPMINLVAAWRTSEAKVHEAGGVPDRPALREYMPRLRAALDAYRPVTRPSPS